MATAFRDFYFYEEYEWRHDDFANFQTWIKARIKGLAEAAFGGSVLSGLQVVPLSGMTVRVKAGLAVSPTGQLLILSADTDVALSAPVGNPSKSLLVIRPKLTDTTTINEPLNPSNPVPLHQLQEAEVVELAGTPAPSPVYPSAAAEDVQLMGFALTSGHVTVVITDFETYQRHARAKGEVNVGTKTVTGSLSFRDDIVEADASASGMVLSLPDAKDYLGKEFHIVKVDSSANTVTVSGSIVGQTISGQASVELTDQWERVTVYGRRNAWGIK